MTIQDDFFEQNVATATGDKKLEMIKSTQLLLGYVSATELSLAQIARQLLNTREEFFDLLDAMYVDGHNYVALYPNMKAAIDEVIFYRELIRGNRPGQPYPEPNIPINEVNEVNATILYLWKGVPQNARLASVASTLTIKGGTELSVGIEVFCDSLADFLPLSEIYDFLTFALPVKRQPITTFNNQLSSGDVPGIDPQIVFGFLTYLAVQDQLETQTTPVFC